jgi:DNA-binding transcriptional regulator YiaG
MYNGEKYLCHSAGRTMSMKTSYRELDYESGRAIQELRTKICLTQTGLGEQLGVSARTVREWESGGNYPKAEHLKALIALAVKSRVFSEGSEAEEIRKLWKTTRQKWLLDEDWLSALFSQPSSQPSDLPPEAVEEAKSSATHPLPHTEVALYKDHRDSALFDQNHGDSALFDQNHGDSSLFDQDRRDSALCLSEGAGPLSYPPQEINLTSAPTPTETLLDSKGDSKLRPEIATNLHFEEQSSRGPGSETLSGADLVNISSANASWHKKRGVRRKRLLISLIALAILTIIGSAGTLFFLARNHTTQVNNTATDQTYPGYLPGHGTLAFFDPLSQEHGSQWKSYSYSDSGGTCQFSKGAYHISQPVSGYYAPCAATGTFSNFAFEVQVTIIQGDCGGVIFRDDGNGHFYVFSLCEDGGYREMKYVDNTGSGGTTLWTNWSPAIHTGLGQQNTIAVVASGSTMTFYANKQQIAQVQDSSYTSGLLSLFAFPGFRHPTEVVYRNARMWTL